jgi:transposase
MYPFLSNHPNKGQPAIEKRFEQINTVHEIVPVSLKPLHRIEALFTLYFLALLVQALIDRELRPAMKRERLKELPPYPEQRSCRRPTTEQILRLFSLAQRHTLIRNGRIAQVLLAELTDTERQVLGLLDVPRMLSAHDRGCGNSCKITAAMSE